MSNILKPRNPRAQIKTSAKNSTTSASKRFTSTVNNRCSPFSSFVTKGLRVRNRNPLSEDFAYDLSKDELLFVGGFKTPMKEVPTHQRELLKNGQRGAYLAMRYEDAPKCKYNYPEATSWRIGWLHNQENRQLLL